MRTIRRLSQIFLTTAGTATVIYAVMRIEPLRDRLLVVALGLVIMELGIWQITTVFFPNEREFKPLREETDYFLKLVRRLNAASLRLHKGAVNVQPDIDRLREEMYHSVDRMTRLAGQTEAELAYGTEAKPSWSWRSKKRIEPAAARSDLQQAAR